MPRGGGEQRNLGVLLDEVVDRPLVGEKQHGGVLVVGAKADIAAQVGSLEGLDVHRWVDPADLSIRSVLQADLGAVFGLQAVLDDFKLELAHGAQEDASLEVIVEGVGLDGTFVEQLFQTFHELFVLGWR